MRNLVVCLQGVLKVHSDCISYLKGGWLKMKNIIKFIEMTFLILTLVYGLYNNSFAEIPRLINYQGRLTDANGTSLNGSYQITFRIYDAETVGTLLWQETHSGLLIQKGVFGVLLGSVTPLNLAFDKPYWLEIKVGDEVMTPKQQITSAAYAIRAERAEIATQAETATKALTIEARNSDPVSPVTGQIWLRTD